jgi:hypothetical protein
MMDGNFMEPKVYAIWEMFTKKMNAKLRIQDEQ